MALNQIQQWKFDKLKARIGEMTSDEALRLCIQAEQFANDVGPDDQAFEYFVTQKRDLLEYADLLDKLGK